MNKLQLINGDAFKTLDNLIEEGVKVDMILIDPPYSFKKGSNGGGGMLATRKYDKQIITKLGGKNLDIGLDINILDKFRLLFDKKMFNIVSFGSEEMILEMKQWALENKMLSNVLIWHKTNPVPTCNNKYLDDVEFMIQIKEKSGKKIGGTYHTKSKVYTSQVNKKDKKLYGHPTIKPIELIEKLITNHTNEEDVVLDCFMGSGTTGVACQNLNRGFIGVELEEKYFKIAENRIKEANKGVK